MKHYWLLACLVNGGFALLCLAPSVFAATPPPSPPVVYEAETGALHGPIKIMNDDSASGGKVVGNFEEEGSGLTFTNIDGGAGGTMTLTITYSNGAATDAVANMAANGTNSTVSFKPTGGWNGGTCFKEASCDIRMKPGTDNTITLNSTGAAWICDKISLRPSETANRLSGMATSLAGTRCRAMALNVVADFWPYLIVILIMVITAIVRRRQGLYY